MKQTFTIRAADAPRAKKTRRAVECETDYLEVVKRNSEAIRDVLRCRKV